MQILIHLSFAILALSMVLCLARLVMGPSLPDRVVALELLSMIIVGIIGVHTLQSDETSFLDVAIVVALMSFLATVGFARFLERGGRRDD
ncbi:monovalent cation/H+ antiporter complex subunit F [Kushneria phyllosphaerae]|uniref:Na(+)/H(+) antiporter subunit F n=1 Tax=Kushneria phyllosphaerae TaxID=2100822 RepID=A0A2R8CL70_9GAMM|nr:cation:proton antiporter [Kushneria phyllosphaerae]SPJ33658.1 Na(+)/H(+) antiporter subunit F [Kushneria phyllosphaerae]